MPLLADAALALGALISFIVVGAAALRMIRAPSGGLEGLAFGAGFGVLIHGLAGVAVALSPAKQATAWGLFAVLWGGAAWTLWRTRDPSFARGAEVRQTLAVLGVFVVGCAGASHLQIRFPRVLPDGLYIFKEHTLPVKMQLLTGGLPVDNYIPFAVGEYLLRDISFTREHPIIPGQEVSNRPVLMALAAVPFRAALDPPPRQHGPLGHFHYVGSDWPDVGSFMAGDGFRQFLMVGIALNALVLLGAALVFAEHAPRGFLVPGLLLLATSPFYLSQTLFTWPKLLAAFYLLLALHALARGKNAASVAVAGALAYWSHPFALVYVCGFGGHYAAAAWTRRERGAFVRYMVIVGLALAPWFAWAYLALRLPTNMISQNIAGQGVDSWVGHVWVRVVNLYQAFAATTIGVHPFDAHELFRQTISRLPGILGLLTLPAYAGLVWCWRSHRVFVVQGVIVPALLLSIPFSRPARLTWLAFHGVGVCLMLLGLIVIARAPRRWAWSLVAAQIVLQLALLAVYGRSLGATFTRDGTAYRLLDHRLLAGRAWVEKLPPRQRRS